MAQKTKIIYSNELPEVWREEIEVRDSLNWFLVFQGNVPREVDLKIHLSGIGSRGEIKLVYFGKEKNETVINITLLHEASETYGRVSVKAALFDESRLNFRGMLDIGPDAKGADSYLSAKALLVSPKACAEIYPYLEIKTDEVKASHGSSIGRIDEKQLFYLQSRGIKREEAQKIILSEFFRDVSCEISSELFHVV